MRLWWGLAGFVVLVAALAFIALDRIEDRPELAGRWNLVVVETPEGTFEPGDQEWIEFDGQFFTGRMTCIDFEGDFIISEGTEFNLNGWGWSQECDGLEGTGYAFENYFHQISELRFDPDLLMQNGDGSVRFVFTREGPSEASALRAW